MHPLRVLAASSALPPAAVAQPQVCAALVLGSTLGSTNTIHPIPFIECAFERARCFAVYRERPRPKTGALHLGEL